MSHPQDPVHVPTAQLERWPLAPDSIVHGQPDASGRIQSTSACGRIVRGIWACTPGAFRWTWTDDELVVVVQGRATVDLDDGQSVQLVPGDMAFFEAGRSSVWTIHEPFRKSFHTMAPAREEATC